MKESETKDDVKDLCRATAQVLVERHGALVVVIQVIREEEKEDTSAVVVAQRRQDVRLDGIFAVLVEMLGAWMVEQTLEQQKLDEVREVVGEMVEKRIADQSQLIH